MTDLVGIIKKHGVTGVLVAWLFFTNSRLTTVEQALYQCYNSNRVSTAIGYYPTTFIKEAILPKELKIEKA